MRDELNKVVRQAIEAKYLNQRVSILYKKGRDTIHLDPEGPYTVKKVEVELGIVHERNQWRESFTEPNVFRFKLSIEDSDTEEKVTIFVHSAYDL